MPAWLSKRLEISLIPPAVFNEGWFCTLTSVEINAPCSLSRFPAWPGAEWKWPFVWPEGDVIQDLKRVLHQAPAELLELGIQAPGGYFENKLDHHQQPDYSDQEVKKDSEDQDEQTT